jgi:phage portal protein BeeE
MSARNRRRRQRDRQARPVAARTVERAVQSSPSFVQTYTEPSAERLTPEFEAYSRLAFGGNGVVFGAINFRAKLFSEARLCWRDLSDMSLTYNPRSALSKLANPWPNGTTGDLLTRMEQDASLAGNAYVRDCGNRLERLRPDWVTIVSWVTVDDRGHEVREVIGYMYEPTGDPERKPDWYPVEEVAHWAPTPDPLANWRGMSWLTPVIREINADKAMIEHQDKFYRNAATPNIIIKYEKKMTSGQKIGLAESIAARHGGPANAGGTLVLDEGADPMVVGSKLSDSEFSDALAANENRIAVASGVPAMVIGLKEGLQAAAWSMYRQACRAVADTTLRPNWRGACAALSVLVDVPEGYELWFDTRDVAALQEGETEIAGTMQTNAATANSFIAAGFEPDSVVKAITSGDMTLLKHTGLVSVQLLPPGTDTGAPGADQAQRSEVDDLERSDPMQRRDAKGRWSKGGGAVAAALSDGLDDALDGFNREQLRREAKRRGLDPRRGAPADEIRDMLWDHHHEQRHTPAPDTPEGRRQRIRQVYEDLAPERSGTPAVPLADLRKRLDGMSRQEQDAALVEMALSGQIVLWPQENQKAITAADREAALNLGGEAKHLIAIENEHRTGRGQRP